LIIRHELVSSTVTRFAKRHHRQLWGGSGHARPAAFDPLRPVEMSTRLGAIQFPVLFTASWSV